MSIIVQFIYQFYKYGITIDSDWHMIIYIFFKLQ